MIIDEIVHFLQKVPPFQFLKETELKAVAECMTTEFYPRDSVILKQDDKASDALRIIQKGGVKVAVRTESGEEMIIDHRSEGKPSA